MKGHRSEARARFRRPTESVVLRRRSSVPTPKIPPGTKQSGAAPGGARHAAAQIALAGAVRVIGNGTAKSAPRDAEEAE